MVMREIMESIVGLGCIIISYAALMPFMNYLRDFTIEMGAWAGPAFWISKMANWFFVIMAVWCFVYPIMAIYRKTYDQGQDYVGR